MKIMVIGASGALGTAVSAELSARHETVAIGRTSGDFHADMRELTSLRTMFQKVGKVDAIVCTAGSVHFGPWSELTPEKFELGLRDKLMGQVNVVLAGQKFLHDGGSFTLTSGILSEDPIRYGAAASLVNGALERPARFTKFGDSCAGLYLRLLVVGRTYSQIVRDREYVRNGTGPQVREILVRLRIDHAFERHVSISHDDVDGRKRGHSIAGQYGVAINCAIDGSAQLIVHRRDGENFNLIVDRGHALDTFYRVFSIAFQRRAHDLAEQCHFVTLDLKEEIIEYGIVGKQEQLVTHLFDQILLHLSFVALVRSILDAGLNCGGGDQHRKKWNRGSGKTENPSHGLAPFGAAACDL